MPLPCSPMTDIGRAIREAREAQRMTIKRLAELADVDERTVGRIERGEVKNPSKAGELTRVLRIGIHARGRGDNDSSGLPRDPRLSEATFTELLGALAAVYGRDVREATETTRLASREELPPDVATRATSGTIPAGWDHPNEGNSTG
jgi:transcriptional regulator with XRE-family HTH domain